jgi:hypothetical protein
MAKVPRTKPKRDIRCRMSTHVSHVKFIPRKDNSNGYRIPKMHGMTKMQEYMKLFGSAMNFNGGLGEAAHKTFVKSAGQKTQRRVSEFAKQTANQYYNGLLTSYAMKH